MKANQTEENEEDNNGGKETEVSSFYISMALGFIVGFWAVCGTLLMKASWRHAYFQFFDNLKEKVVVFLMVNAAHFRRNQDRVGENLNRLAKNCL